MAFFSLFNTFITPRITAVQTRSQIRVQDVKVELGLDTIDTEPDKNIGIYLKAVKAKADSHLNNTFLNLDGTPYLIPWEVEAWVLKQTAHVYNYQLGVEQENAPHIGWIKWASNVDYSLIENLRINPGF